MNYIKNKVNNKIIRILGIDPGLRHTGWAIVDKKCNNLTYVASGVIDTDSKISLALRLANIFTHVHDISLRYYPTSASMEETYVNKNFGSSLKLAHARAAAMVAVSSINIDVLEYSSKTVKKTITGSGSADKMQINKMLSMLIPDAKNISSEDESDALAIAICHALFYQLND